MKRASIPALSALPLALIACGSTPQTITIQSLQASGRSSFLCLSSETYAPRSIDDCPDQQPYDGEDRHIYSMVTQTARGEVAVVDLSAGTVLDEDVSQPGFTFLPIGQNPTSIVSTPGSTATFVGVTETGKEGIYAIPSTCVRPRSNGQPVRDVTSWPACRLPSAPGDLTVLIEPPENPSKPNDARESCDGTSDPNEGASAHGECPADLSLEMSPPGRRKLAVTLPSRGEVAILDAQRVLNLEPGSFLACPIEKYVPLGVGLPKMPIAQQLPPDLVGKPLPTGLFHLPPPTSFDAHPTTFAKLDDPITQEHRLFIADDGAPVIHVLDTTDPCDPVEGPPLLPESFTDPQRTVLSTRLAVSPLTNDQSRYLYAVDGTDALGGGSVMIFDVSPGSTNRTPLLRPYSAELPFEPPDRIAFDAPARDVTFALHDDPTVNLGASPPPQPIGVECDPNPDVPASAPGGRYRPAADLSTGARPSELRGVFGFVALDTGHVSIIDVDDFDARCRRPITINPTATTDFRGCANDVLAPKWQGFEDQNGNPTVTNEASCRVVETNRARSATVLQSDPNFGVHAPSLRQLPRLIDPSGRALVTDRSAAGLEHPRLLAVNFSEASPAQLYVGTDVYAAAPTDIPGRQSVASVLSGPNTDVVNPLVIDPKDADENSVVLNLFEPRSYLPDELYSARYEGPLSDLRPAGTFHDNGDGTGTFTDGTTAFCDLGVEDENAACDRARGLLQLSDSVSSRDCQNPAYPAGNRPDDLGEFAALHADYVQITSDIPDKDNSWWQHGGASCRIDASETGGYDACNTLFGTSIAPAPTRDLHIIAATRNVLKVRPRTPDQGSMNGKLLGELIQCCFPSTVSYAVRASDEWVLRGSQSGFRQHMTSNSEGACVVDDDPLKARLNARIIETSCDDGCPAVGPPHAGEVACIFRKSGLPSQTIGAPNSQCIFQGLNTNFAIYAGQSVSQRDMEFDWEVLGGFSPLILTVAADGSINASPESVEFMPQIGSLVVTDGASKGLVLIDLSTFAVTTYQ